MGLSQLTQTEMEAQLKALTLQNEALATENRLLHRRVTTLTEDNAALLREREAARQKEIMSGVANWPIYKTE